MIAAYEFLKDVHEARIYAAMTAVCAMTFLMLAYRMLMLYAEDPYDQDADIYHSIKKRSVKAFYEYSWQNRIYAYQNGIRIFRQGTAVSKILSKIVSIDTNESEEDRMLYIIIQEGDKFRKESVSCGRMSDLQFSEAKAFMLEYGS